MEIMKIRRVLENEHQRLMTELGLDSTPDPNEEPAVSPFNKKMEAASQITELEQKAVKASRMKQQLSDIEHALEKVDQGTYGICDNCGKLIAEERLKAIPQASLCVPCRTKQHRMLLNSYAR